MPASLPTSSVPQVRAPLLSVNLGCRRSFSVEPKRPVSLRKSLNRGSCREEGEGAARPLRALNQQSAISDQKSTIPETPPKESGDTPSAAQHLSSRLRYTPPVIVFRPACTTL